MPDCTIYYGRRLAARRQSDQKRNLTKCNYCVWIVDDAVSRFDESKDFNAIVSSQIEAWHEWVKKKIDAAEFKNRALKIDKTGEKEIALSEMVEHVKMD